MFGISHGCCNAIFLPNVIRFNQSASTKFPDLARLVGGNTAEDLAQAIEKLRSDVNNIGSIRAYGISEDLFEEKLDYMANNALIDPCTGFNPRKPTVEELKTIYRLCFEGAVYQES